MRAATKKLTTAAVCTALAVIMCVMTAYLPLSFMPLYLAAFCIFLAAKRGSLPYGILCALASIGLMFLMTGLSVKWLLLVIMFAPYGILTYFIDRFNYFKWKKALIRIAIAAVFFNATFACVYLIGTRLITIGVGDINIGEWVQKVGGYAVLALVATVILMPLDFIFSSLSMVVLKKLPAATVTRRSERANSKAVPPVSEAKLEYDDVFGYEIYEKHKEDGDSADKPQPDGGGADRNEE